MRGSSRFPHLWPASDKLTFSKLVNEWRGITICLRLIDAEALISFASNASEQSGFGSDEVLQSVASIPEQKMGVLGRLSGKQMQECGVRELGPSKGRSEPRT